MALLNYTTTVNAQKSAQQIQSLLVAAHAEKIMYDFKGGILDAIAFQLKGPDGGPIAFSMPANAAGVLSVLKRSKIANRLKTIEHATNVAWRIQKDWIEAQVAKVQCGMAEITEVFMPYIITNNGQRMFERFSESGFKAIGMRSEDQSV